MKRALIITYYWPPAGGPGVQRWLKFVKYLRDYNIEPVVYIPENPSYPIIDDTFFSDIPKDIEILKVPIKEPYKLAKKFSKKKTQQISSGLISNKKQSFIEKLLLYIRGNFFIPDARKAWVKPSVKFLKNYLVLNTVDIIITTGPPHSLHLIGLGLKKNLNIKWIADFRDPWTSIGYHNKLKLSKASKQKHLNMEAEVLNTADAIIVTSKTTKAEFKTKTEKPIEVITNGYDSLSEKNNLNLDTKFSLVHIGSLLSGRNPVVLWEIISELCNENTDFANNFSLKFAGVVSGEVLQSIKEYSLDKYLDFKGYVSHTEAIKLQQTAQILLLLEIDSSETRCIIPGKLFEYMLANRPILALGPEGSDIKDIIDETNIGTFFLYSEKAKLKKQLLGYFENFKLNSLQNSPQNIIKYSRKELTKTLASLINLTTK